MPFKQLLQLSWDVTDQQQNSAASSTALLRFFGLLCHPIVGSRVATVSSALRSATWLLAPFTTTAIPAMSSKVLATISFSSLPGETQIADPFALSHGGEKRSHVTPGKGVRRLMPVMVLPSIRLPAVTCPAQSVWTGGTMAAPPGCREKGTRPGSSTVMRLSRKWSGAP